MGDYANPWKLEAAKLTLLRAWDGATPDQHAPGGNEMLRETDPYVYLPLITVPEAARYLGVSRKTVYMLIEFGEIVAVRERGAVRVEKKSLDEFRASGKLT